MPKRHRLPIPMSREDLLRYQWQQDLATALTAPIDLNSLATGSQVLDMYIEHVKHVFANPVPAAGLPALEQTLWGYRSGSGGPAQYPGPLLQATSGQSVTVRWNNNLGSTALHKPYVEPPMDACSGGGMQRYRTGTTSVHLHGGHLPWIDDGYPMRHHDFQVGRPAAASCSVMSPHPAGTSVTFTYPNSQQGGATLWYHDHAMDSTGGNVYAGLAGGYLLRHPNEEKILGPFYVHELPVVIQDRSFIDASQWPDDYGRVLLYGDADFLESRIQDSTFRSRRIRSTTQTGPDGWVAAPSPEFKGRAMLVNGLLWPQLEVEPAIYRLRILNGCNSRMLVLRIVGEDSSRPELKMPVRDATTGATLPLWQIGSDGGLLPKVAVLTGRAPTPGIKNVNSLTMESFLVLAPGERADVLVDFSLAAGGAYYLSNHAAGTPPLGNAGDDTSDPLDDPIQQSFARSTGSVLRFVINQTAGQSVPSGTSETGKLIDDINNALQKLRTGPLSRAPTPELYAPAARAFQIMEFPVNFQPEDQTDADSNLRTPGRFGWKGIGFRDLTAPRTIIDFLLWAGPVPHDLAATKQIGPMPTGGPLVTSSDVRPAPRGTVYEIWDFYNDTGDVHPLHLHLVNFRIIGRYPLKPSPFPGTTMAKVPRRSISDIDSDFPELSSVSSYELGWKDTVRANPGELTRLLVAFHDGSDYNSGIPTIYGAHHFVWHCHLLEHEDMGMMRPLELSV